MREWYQLFLHEWQIKKAKGLSYPKVWLLPDCALEQLFYGVSPAEYFTYEFFKKARKNAGNMLPAALSEGYRFAALDESVAPIHHPVGN